MWWYIFRLYCSIVLNCFKVGWGMIVVFEKNSNFLYIGICVIVIWFSIFFFGRILCFLLSMVCNKLFVLIIFFINMFVCFLCISEIVFWVVLLGFVVLYIFI